MMRFVLLPLMCLGLLIAATDMAPTVAVNPPAGTTDFFTQFAAYDVEAMAGNQYVVGCGHYNGYLLATSGAALGGAGTGLFTVLDYDGNFLENIDQNNAPSWGLRDLTTCGTYIYGSHTSLIEYYDPSGLPNDLVKVGAFTGNQNPNRALAHDGTYFYTGNFGTEVYRLTWDGVSGSTATSSIWSTAATSVYGAAWDDVNNCMWVTSADYSGIVAQIDEDGNLIANHTPISGGIYGGVTMGQSTPENHLWILEQGTPDMLRGYDITPVSLSRGTWGSIKTVF